MGVLTREVSEFVNLVTRKAAEQVPYFHPLPELLDNRSHNRVELSQATTQPPISQLTLFAYGLYKLVSVITRKQTIGHDDIHLQ